MKYPVTVRNTAAQEDQLLIHAHIRGIKRRATMAQIAYDEGMEVLKGRLPSNWQELLQEAKEKGGWV